MFSSTKETVTLQGRTVSDAKPAYLVRAAAKQVKYTSPAMAFATPSQRDTPWQPYLFPQMAAVAPLAEFDRRRAGKSLVQKLLKTRRSLTPEEEQFLPQLNHLIEQIRGVSKFSDHQREELVLYAIERSGATTPNEIAEDTKFSRDAVNEILHELAMRKIIYQTRRYVPGSDRPQFAIKSRRVAVPEAD